MNPPPPPILETVLIELLSPRQKQCLALAIRGLNSIQIAAELDLSRRTVDQYFGEACKRLGANNRIHAVAIAVGDGL